MVIHQTLSFYNSLNYVDCLLRCKVHVVKYWIASVVISCILKSSAAVFTIAASCFWIETCNFWITFYNTLQPLTYNFQLLFTRLQLSTCSLRSVNSELRFAESWLCWHEWTNPDDFRSWMIFPWHPDTSPPPLLFWFMRSMPSCFAQDK